MLTLSLSLILSLSPLRLEAAIADGPAARPVEMASVDPPDDDGGVTEDRLLEIFGLLYHEWWEVTLGPVREWWNDGDPDPEEECPDVVDRLEVLEIRARQWGDAGAASLGEDHPSVGLFRVLEREIHRTIEWVLENG